MEEILHHLGGILRRARFPPSTVRGLFEWEIWRIDTGEVFGLYTKMCIYIYIYVCVVLFFFFWGECGVVNIQGIWGCKDHKGFRDIAQRFENQMENYMGSGIAVVCGFGLCTW